MLSTLEFTLNAVFPIFMFLVIGIGIGRLKIFREDFYSSLEKFVFNVSLPVMLFHDVSTSDIGEVFDIKFTLFCVACIAFSILAPMCTVPSIVKDNQKRGAVIQGLYRSNMAIIGLPMLNSMFGSAGSAVMATVMPFGVLMYNISAVIILSIYAPADKKMSGKELKSHIFKTIVKNPLILSILAAFLIVMIKVELPECVNKGLSLLGDTTLPLAMIALGAGFKFSSIKGKAKYSLTVTAIKIIILPILMIAVTLALGYRGVNLGVIIAVFGGPVAVASYIMASNMGSDKEIAAQILIFTTLGSMFTLFIQIFLLKSLGVL